MSKNKLSDLNDHLFMQMERLGDESLTDADLKKEMGRAQALVNVAGQIIASGRLTLDVLKAAGPVKHNIKKAPLLGDAYAGIEEENEDGEYEPKARKTRSALLPRAGNRLS